MATVTLELVQHLLQDSDDLLGLWGELVPSLRQDGPGPRAEVIGGQLEEGGQLALLRGDQHSLDEICALAEHIAQS